MEQTPQPIIRQATYRGRKRQPSGELGILLDRLIAEKGWSIRDYAREAGFSSYQQVTEYMKGDNPSPKTLAKLLAPFGLEAHHIIQIRETGTNHIVQTITDSINGK